MTQTIGLVMMTRQEEVNIRRCHASVEHLISSFTVVDVGSEDRTVEVAKELGATVYEREWVDFNHNNRETLALAKGTADYHLWVGANDTITQHDEIPELTAPYYMVTNHHYGLDFRMPILLKDGIDWHYSGPPCHGFLCPEFFAERQDLDAISILHRDDDGRRPEKVARYLAMLEEWYVTHPDCGRTIYYLAQSLRDVGRFREAAEMYGRRVLLGGGWDEELWHAHFQQGVCQIRQGLFEEGRNTLMAAYWRRPTRPEPLYYLAKSMLPPAGDLLFIEPDCYGVPDL